MRVTGADSDVLDDLLSGTESVQDVAARFPRVADRLTEFANDAFIAGFNNVFRLDTALALVGLFVAIAFVGGPLRLRRGKPVEEHAAQEADS